MDSMKSIKFSNVLTVGCKDKTEEKEGPTPNYKTKRNENFFSQVSIKYL